MVKGSTVGILEGFDEAIKDNQELESEQKEKLYKLMVEFKGIFSQINGDIGRTSQVQHSIDTSNAPKICQPVCRTAPAVRGQYRKLIQEMLE